MADDLRDRLADYCTRIKAGPVAVPADGVLAINAESLADALLPFIKIETSEKSPSTAAMLAEFHHALGDKPSRGNAPLRITLHAEEHAELVEALAEEDRAHIARELADVVYVAYGTAHAFDIDLDAALTEVHRASMSKLVGPGLPLVRGDGKILKPPGFVPPDMTAALKDGARHG